METRTVDINQPGFPFLYNQTLEKAGREHDLNKNQINRNQKASELKLY